MGALSSAKPGVTPFNVKLVVFALVASFHGLVLFSWQKPHTQPTISANEMSVNLELLNHVNPTYLMAQHKTLPVSESLLEKVSQQQPVRIEQQAAAMTSPTSVSSATIKEDSEPVYKASYLDNQPPAYPLAARRMGLQGKVVLQVEVLAEGRCGGILIHTSSGYAMLDNAALEAVKSWHFVPARQSGNAVDKWFIIPVQFSLKDNA